MSSLALSHKIAIVIESGFTSFLGVLGSGSIS